jgi:hypothetical protein
MSDWLLFQSESYNKSLNVQLYDSPGNKDYCNKSMDQFLLNSFMNTN